MMKNAARFLAVWVVPLIVFGTSNRVHATPILPGFDLFATSPSPPNPSTFVDLTVQSGGLVGVVPLKGNPFGPGAIVKCCGWVVSGGDLLSFDSVDELGSLDHVG